MQHVYYHLTSVYWGLAWSAR